MENFKLKSVSALEKVFVDREPSGEGFSGRMSLLKGETASFQIGYFWGGESKGLGKVKINGGKENVRVRAVELVPCNYVAPMKSDDDYTNKMPGVYPDILSEIDEWGYHLVYGQWRSLWVDFETDDNFEAGEYKVEIILFAENEELGKVEVTFEVVNATLPKLSIPHTEWFHTDCLANFYDVEVFSDKHWDIIENFIKTAVKRRCNMILTPIFTPPLDTRIGGERLTVQLVDVVCEDGEYKFDFTKFEKWVLLCKKLGMEYFEISHLFSQWGAVSTPKIMALKDGQLIKLFGWETNSAGKEYVHFLDTFLPELTNKIEELGICKNVYFHVSDEPGTNNIKTYGKAKEIVKEHLKKYKIFDALSDYEFYKNGMVEIPVCATDHIEPFLEGRPKELWAYYCSGQSVNVSNRFMVHQGYRTRIIGTQLYKFAIDGFLHWGYNFYNSQFSLYPINPYVCTDAAEAFPSGDSFLVYPGKRGEPVESMRLMYMYQAMADYSAMKLLEDLKGREAVIALVEEKKEDIRFDKYPCNFSYIEKMRNSINMAIKEAVNKR